MVSGLRRGIAAPGGTVLGAALQLQQAMLWREGVYVAMLCAGVALLGVATACAALVAGGARHCDRRCARGRGPGGLACRGLCGICGLCGLCARRLDPAIEGRDVEVVGVVSEMPQHGEGGTRFRFDIESPSSLPSRIALGW